MANSVCTQCDGSGWKIVERDGLSGAERCECFIERMAADPVESANIPPLYRDASLENFSLPHDNPIAYRDLSRVVLSVQSFVKEYPFGPKPGLLLIGPTGTGKTHLAIAALRRLLARGFQGVFFDYLNLLERIRAGYSADAGASQRETYQVALDAEVLLLDDLGSHRVLGWIEDTITAIITHRCNNKKPLIATTNLPDPDAGDIVVQRNQGVSQVEYRTTLSERIGERARSRLFEMCEIVRLPAVGDYRIRKNTPGVR